MRRRTVLAVGATSLAGCSDALKGPDAAEAETLIRDGLTELRDSEGLPALPAEPSLRETAREHSADMAEREFYGHENPDGLGPSDRAGCAAGEVLHRGEIGEMRNVGSDEIFNTFATDELAAYVVEGWTVSDSHRELVLSARWSAMGVGVHIADEEFFATALFC